VKRSIGSDPTRRTTCAAASGGDSRLPGLSVPGRLKLALSPPAAPHVMRYAQVIGCVWMDRSTRLMSATGQWMRAKPGQQLVMSRRACSAVLRTGAPSTIADRNF